MFQVHEFFDRFILNTPTSMNELRGEMLNTWLFVAACHSGSSLHPTGRESPTCIKHQKKSTSKKWSCDFSRQQENEVTVDCNYITNPNNASRQDILQNHHTSSNHLLRMVMARKYNAEDVIGHPNHSLTKGLDAYGLFDSPKRGSNKNTPKTNSSHLKIGHQKRKLFQPSIFRSNY